MLVAQFFNGLQQRLRKAQFVKILHIGRKITKKLRIKEEELRIILYFCIDEDRIGT